MARTLITLALLCFGATLSASAEGGHHTFWEVKGPHNTVYLLGSVHMLKQADRTLPPEVLRAYDRSQALMMELDLNALNPETMLGLALGSSLLPEDKTLAEAVGPKLFATFLAHAKPLGLDPEMTAHFQPWFAALIVEQMTLAHAGFEADAGVDMQLAQRAAADHKSILALETAEQQLGIFSHLSLPQQREFLSSTLEELDNEAAQAADMIGAWRRGDIDALESLLRQESAQSPELFRMLTTDRNHKWLPRIIALFADTHDDMIVVGAMHLIGTDGLIELLKRAGYNAVQH